MTEIRVQDIPRLESTLQDRLTKAEQEHAQRWGVPCGCACDCTVRHRFGKSCALCGRDDHWRGLADLLERITARQEARLTDPPEHEEDA